MPSVRETAYPRLKSGYSQKEVHDIYTPTPEELIWAEQNTRGDRAHMGLLVLLKISQRLGYFMALTEIPEAIMTHIAQAAGVPLVSSDDWNEYHASGTHKRHRALIREYLGIRFFDGEARQTMCNAMADVALIKDEPADLANVAIETLTQQNFELPAFSTLAEASRHIHAQSYRELYHKISQSLGTDAIAAMDDLFQTTAPSWLEKSTIISLDFSQPLTGLADLTGFVCSGVASAPSSEDVCPSLTAKEPGWRRERMTVLVSVRWYPRPGCYPALIRIPRRHVVATGMISELFRE